MSFKSKLNLSAEVASVVMVPAEGLTAPRRKRFAFTGPKFARLSKLRFGSELQIEFSDMAVFLNTDMSTSEGSDPSAFRDQCFHSSGWAGECIGSNHLEWRAKQNGAVNVRIKGNAIRSMVSPSPRAVRANQRRERETA